MTSVTSKVQRRYCRYTGMAGYSNGTVPFSDPTQRSIHFRKHGHEFSAANELDYEQMADAFMNATMHPNMHEGNRLRTSGSVDRIRLDAVSLHFGVAYNVVTIRTYFILKAQKIARHGSAAAFMVAECAKVL